MAKKRVFVCFHTNDLASVRTLLGWDQDGEFDFVFEEALPRVAFHSEAAKEIKAALTEKIRSATHLLCIIGKESGNNDWVNWEVQTASVSKRKVIATRLHLNYKSPNTLLNFGATWAKAFTLEAIQNAIDAANAATTLVVPREAFEGDF